MFCKNRITLIGCLGKDTETRFAANGTAHTRFSLATSVSWKDWRFRRIQDANRVASDRGLGEVWRMGWLS
jgi:single-stranded DNA-binding protein